VTSAPLSGERSADLDALIAAAPADLVFRQSSATAAEAD
jgi:hypothetical protein